MAERWLLLETSGRVGEAGLADGDRLLASVRLDSGRQHARDLTPAIANLLDRAGWRARDISAVAVSIGPGSYTGLRVGLMTAKAIAYANGCALSAVPTFHIIARQARCPATRLDVVADALKGKIYVQPFERAAANEEWSASGELKICEVAEWLAQREPTEFVNGPGVAAVGPTVNAIPEEFREPRVGTLLDLAISARYICRDIFNLEPLYLRPSSAEEQWNRLGKPSA